MKTDVLVFVSQYVLFFWIITWMEIANNFLIVKVQPQDVA